MKKFVCALMAGLMVLGGSGCAGGIGGEKGADGWKPRLALQLYSFRDRSFTEAVVAAKRLGFQYVEAYPGQKLGGSFAGDMSFKLPVAQREEIKRFLNEQGVKLVSFGVVGAGSEREWTQLFQFAQDMGIEIVQVEAGKSPEVLDMLNVMAFRHTVKVALHNHAQAAGYPSAMATQLQGRPNLGAGPDTGHWVCAGINPRAGIKELEGTCFTLHLVDIDKFGKDGRVVPYGKGVADLKGVLAELRKQGFEGTVTCEYEYMSPKLEEEIGECVRWYNGVLP